MIYRQQGQTVAIFPQAGGRCGLLPLGACEWAMPAAPVISGVGKKRKKEKNSLQPSTTHFCSHSPRNIPALQLPLPNALGDAQMLDHCPPSQDPTTRRSWYSTSCVGYVGWGTSCVVCRWQGQTTAVITDSRGGHGPPPPGIPEQEPLRVPTTSESTAEEDIVMEHHLLLL